MMKEEKSEAGFLAGRNAVREALERESSRIVKVMLSANVSEIYGREIRLLARSMRVPVQTVPARRLEKDVPRVNHQGVVAVLAAVAYTDVADLLTNVAPTVEDVQSLKPVIVILDGIQDPYNLGAIIRSAVAAGAAGIILPERNTAPMSAAVMKTSAGTALRIPVARAPSLIQVIEEMQERGYWIVGATGSAETTIWEMDWDRPLGIVIGSEEKGMRSTVEKACDFHVSIPMRGDVESLNASVAAGILLFAAAQVKHNVPIGRCSTPAKTYRDAHLSS